VVSGGVGRLLLFAASIGRVDSSTCRTFGPAAGSAHGLRQLEGEAYGRPVGVAFDKRGGRLVADDVGNAIWRVAPR